METLDAFIADLVAHMAHSRRWSLEQATVWVEEQIALTRETYRAHGAPLGDTDEGFLAWLQPRYPPPTV